jgi:cysteine desulfurase
MQSLYFDYCSSTPVDSRVQEAILPYWSQHFANPANLLHERGWQAQTAVENARKKIARLLNCEPCEIAFTSGATESNNWALKGFISNLRKHEPGLRPHVISSPFEHSSVSEVLKYLASEDQIELTLVPVNSQGHIDLEILKSNVKLNTRLVSVMWCQNEIGSQQNIQQIANWTKKHNLILHTDATQMVGKYPIDLSSTPVDLLSFSGHKIYGPKGIGALFIRKNKPILQLLPLLHGGSQEPLGRSGTLNVPGIVGLGHACEICQSEMLSDLSQAEKIHSHFVNELKNSFSKKIIFNSPESLSSKYLLNITLPHLDPDDLLPQLARLCLSTGSACRSFNSTLSPALKALGRDKIPSPSTHLRLSWGRMSTLEDAHTACEILIKSMKSLNFCALAGSDLETSQPRNPMIES